MKRVLEALMSLTIDSYTCEVRLTIRGAISVASKTTVCTLNNTPALV